MADSRRRGENALATTNEEIVRQRQQFSDLLDKVRDLTQVDTQDNIRPLAAENTSLAHRLRRLDDERQQLCERLDAARSYSRFLDRKLGDLEARLLD